MKNKDNMNDLVLSKSKQAIVERHKTSETIHNDRYRIGGNIVRTHICYSEDEKTFFCCSGSVVKTYNVATGALLGILEGHTARVTDVLINPENNLQVITASHDGTIRKWDYIESSCLEIINVGAPILHTAIADQVLYMICDPQHYLRELELQLKEPHIKISNDSWRLIKHDLNSKSTTILFRCRKVLSLAISNDRQYVVILQPTSFIVYSIHKQCRVNFTHTRTFTTLAIHPSQHILSTGDTSGRITLWINFDKAFTESALQAISHDSKLSNSYLITTTFHWHANTVYALAFSEDGSYLLSGADEAVLVFWQMSTGQKQFLPRLGAPILHITTSPRGSMYAVACADNAIRMVNAVDNRILHHIQGLQLATSSLFTTAAFSLDNETKAIDRENALAKNGLSLIPTGLVPHPVTGAITLVGKQGYLQMFDVYTDRHLANLAVVERNYVSQPKEYMQRNQATINITKSNDTISQARLLGFSPTVRVEHIAYSKTGTWLVTVDRWLDGVTAERSSLKFWKDINAESEGISQNPEFVLNTRSEHAHTETITSIVYHPTEDIVVTTSMDGTFKLWQLEAIHMPKSASETSVTRTEQTWTCVASADYRQTPVHTAAYSTDGSMLAVAFGQVITLWNPHPKGLSLKTTLVHPPPTAHIRYLAFIKDSPYLIAATHTSIYVWNIISCSVAWSYHMQISAVAVHPTLPYFASLVVLPHVSESKEDTTEVVATDKENNPTSTKRKAEEMCDSGNTNTLDEPVLNKKQSKKVALLIFHVESPTPIRVVDASDARYDKMKPKDVKTQNKESPYAASSVYTSSLAFIHRCTVNPSSHLQTNSTDNPYAAPLTDISSIVYLNRSKEIIRLPNALHPISKDAQHAQELLSFSHDKERLAAVQTALRDKPSLFTQLYGQSTAAAAAADTSSISTYNTTNYGNIHHALVSFLKTPSHVIGYLSLVYGNYMDAFLTKKPKTKN